MRRTLISAIIMAIPLGLATAACAQANTGSDTEQPVASQDERMVPMTRPEQSDVISIDDVAAPEKRGVIDDWGTFRDRPSDADVSRYALSPPVIQDGTSITVLSAPDGFNSSAFVRMPDSTGLYMIDNVGDVDEAQARAKEIEKMLATDIELEKQITPANNATYAASYIPTDGGDLKLVNIIVAPDAVMGNTVTLAFTYE